MRGGKKWGDGMGVGGGFKGGARKQRSDVAKTEREVGLKGTIREIRMGEVKGELRQVSESPKEQDHDRDARASPPRHLSGGLRSNSRSLPFGSGCAVTRERCSIVRTPSGVSTLGVGGGGGRCSRLAGDCVFMLMRPKTALIFGPMPTDRQSGV